MMRQPRTILLQFRRCEFGSLAGFVFRMDGTLIPF